jgi:hypothetical protein
MSFFLCGVRGYERQNGVGACAFPLLLLLPHLISASTSSRFFLLLFFSVCCLVAPSSLAAARFFFFWLYIAKMLYHKIKSSKIMFLKDFQ